MPQPVAQAVQAAPVVQIRGDQTPVPAASLFRSITPAGGQPGAAVPAPAAGQPGTIGFTGTLGPAGESGPVALTLTVIDAEGAVWYADVPNKRCVRVREGGEVLQTVNADRGCFACMLGGSDEPRLFIVAAEWRGTADKANMTRNGQVLTVAAPAPKAGWP